MTPTIPRGWRRLRTGTQVRKHDRCWINGFWFVCAPEVDWSVQTDEAETIIRRVRKTKGKK